jgi:hypothetical protein
MLGTRFHIHDSARQLMAVVKLAHPSTLERRTLLAWANGADVMLRQGTDYLGQDTVEVLHAVPMPDGHSELRLVATFAFLMPAWDSRSAAFLLQSVAHNAHSITRIG